MESGQSGQEPLCLQYACECFVVSLSVSCSLFTIPLFPCFFIVSLLVLSFLVSCFFVCLLVCLFLSLVLCVFASLH